MATQRKPIVSPGDAMRADAERLRNQALDMQTAGYRAPIEAAQREMARTQRMQPAGATAQPAGATAPTFDPQEDAVNRQKLLGMQGMVEGRNYDPKAVARATPAQVSGELAAIEKRATIGPALAEEGALRRIGQKVAPQVPAVESAGALAVPATGMVMAAGPNFGGAPTTPAAPTSQPAVLEPAPVPQAVANQPAPIGQRPLTPPAIPDVAGMDMVRSGGVGREPMMPAESAVAQNVMAATQAATAAPVPAPTPTNAPNFYVISQEIPAKVASAFNQRMENTNQRREATSAEMRKQTNDFEHLRPKGMKPTPQDRKRVNEGTIDTRPSQPPRFNPDDEPGAFPTFQTPGSASRPRAFV